jgi:hypothetical protein
LAAVFLVAVFADGFVAAAFFVPDVIEVLGFTEVSSFFAAVLAPDLVEVGDFFEVAGFFAFGPVFALTFAIIYPFYYCICRALLPDLAIIA